MPLPFFACLPPGRALQTYERKPIIHLQIPAPLRNPSALAFVVYYWNSARRSIAHSAGFFRGRDETQGRWDFAEALESKITQHYFNRLASCGTIAHSGPGNLNFGLRILI